MIIHSIISKPELYLDPGSGSMLIQIVLGAVLGLGVLVRVFWSNIKDFFTKSKKTTEAMADPTAIVDVPTAVGPADLPENSNDKII